MDYRIYNMIFIFLLPWCLHGQINFPPVSPNASWSHQLGFTQIEINYSRPQMRGRKIFGVLVPYNTIWRTGAGESTRIRFSDDVLIDNSILKRGYYALYSIPNEDEWTIIFNSDTTLHGDFGYDALKDVLRVKIKPEKTNLSQEFFSIDLCAFQPDFSAFLQIAWENSVIKIPVKSMADSSIEKGIQAYKNLSESGDAGLLYKCAQYYFAQKKELEKALLWSKKSEELVPENFNYAYLTTNILAEMKKYKEAIQAAENTIILGRKKEMLQEVIYLEEKINSWKLLIHETKH